MKKFKAFCKLNGKYYFETGSFKTKKEFCRHLQGNGFTFKPKDVKELACYNYMLKHNDNKFLHDYIHSNKNLREWLKNPIQYEEDHFKKTLETSNKAFLTRINNQMNKLTNGIDYEII